MCLCRECHSVRPSDGLGWLRRGCLCRSVCCRLSWSRRSDRRCPLKLECRAPAADSRLAAQVAGPRQTLQRRPLVELPLSHEAARASNAIWEFTDRAAQGRPHTIASGIVQRIGLADGITRQRCVRGGDGSWAEPRRQEVPPRRQAGPPRLAASGTQSSLHGRSAWHVASCLPSAGRV